MFTTTTEIGGALAAPFFVLFFVLFLEAFLEGFFFVVSFFVEVFLAFRAGARLVAFLATIFPPSELRTRL
jgi:hypothetical protein